LVKILIPHSCWGHRRWMKVELYKEAVKWFPIKNITRKKPMLKLELFFIFKMTICNCHVHNGNQPAKVVYFVSDSMGSRFHILQEEPQTSIPRGLKLHLTSHLSLMTEAGINVLSYNVRGVSSKKSGSNKRSRLHNNIRSMHPKLGIVFL
jgi:hypothetical protein